MDLPKFNPTSFVRRFRVPGGRETLRHIVSHLKGELKSSDRLLAQLWKDRIRVYKDSKNGVENNTEESTSTEESEEKCDHTAPHENSADKDAEEKCVEAV